MIFRPRLPFPQQEQKGRAIYFSTKRGLTVKKEITATSIDRRMYEKLILEALDSKTKRLKPEMDKQLQIAERSALSKHSGLVEKCKQITALSEKIARLYTEVKEAAAKAGLSCGSKYGEQGNVYYLQAHWTISDFAKDRFSKEHGLSKYDLQKRIAAAETRAQLQTILAEVEK